MLDSDPADTPKAFEIIFCDPKGCRALLRVPSTEGRIVCLCWALSNPKGPNRFGALAAGRTGIIFVLYQEKLLALNVAFNISLTT